MWYPDIIAESLPNENRFQGNGMLNPTHELAMSLGTAHSPTGPLTEISRLQTDNDLVVHRSWRLNPDAIS